MNGRFIKKFRIFASVEGVRIGRASMSEPPVDFFPTTYQDTDTSFSQRSALNTSMDPYASASFDDEPPLLDGETLASHFQKKRKKTKREENAH